MYEAVRIAMCLAAVSTDTHLQQDSRAGCRKPHCRAGALPAVCRARTVLAGASTPHEQGTAHWEARCQTEPMAEQVETSPCKLSN